MARRRPSGPSPQELVAQSDGLLYFAGVPGAFCARDLFAGAFKLLGHLEVAPPRPREAAALDDFASQLPLTPLADPSPSLAARLLLPGYEPPLRAEKLEAELAALDRVPMTDGAERTFQFACQVVRWCGNDARCDQQVELLGKLALERLCAEERWRTIAVKVDGQLRPLFRSANEFVATIYRMRGRCVHKSRVSHKRNAARLYLRLFYRGVPLPPTTDPFEVFGRHTAIAADTYEELVERVGGRLPTPTEMKEAADAMKAAMKKETAATSAALEASPKPCTRKPHRRGSKAEVKAAWQQAAWERVLTYVEETSEDPILKLLLEELHESYRPDEEQVVENPNHLPVYPAGLPSPIAFTETPTEDGAATLQIDVAALPHPTPYYVRSRIPRRAPWTLTEYPDGRLVIRVPLSAHPAEAREERAQAYTWASRLCLDFSAPLPTGMKPEAPANAPP